MNVDLGTVVASYAQKLGSLNHLFARGAEHCRQHGISEQDMLQWRLAPDMYPLRNQGQFVCNLASEWAARAAGVPIPQKVDGDSDLAGLQKASEAARKFIQGLRSEQFHGRDDIPVTIDLGQVTPTMPLGQWVIGFATTNLIFHLSIAYAILRGRGVQIGKPDLFAGGL